MLPAHSHPGYRGNEEIISVGYHSYEGGTFPRKKENQRIRLGSEVTHYCNIIYAYIIQYSVTRTSLSKTRLVF
jgi:hypothetical protein